MAFYVYRRPDGTLEQVWMTIAEKERQEKNGKIKLDDGVIGTRDIVAEHDGFTDTPDLWRRPIHSDAAGVGVDQIAQARKHSEEIGIPTDFDSEGRAIFTSRKHRKEYCEAIGLYDKDGGYGDPQRR